MFTASISLQRSIIIQRKTALVESFNSLIRHYLARFNRKTKPYSKAIDMIYNSILMLFNKDLLYYHAMGMDKSKILELNPLKFNEEYLKSLYPTNMNESDIAFLRVSGLSQETIFDVVKKHFGWRHDIFKELKDQIKDSPVGCEHHINFFKNALVKGSELLYPGLVINNTDGETTLSGDITSEDGEDAL